MGNWVYQSGGRQLNSWCRRWTVPCLCANSTIQNQSKLDAMIIFKIPKHRCRKWQILIVLNRTPAWWWFDHNATMTTKNVMIIQSSKNPRMIKEQGGWNEPDISQTEEPSLISTHKPWRKIVIAIITSIMIISINMIISITIFIIISIIVIIIEVTSHPAVALPQIASLLAAAWVGALCRTHLAIVNFVEWLIVSGVMLSHLWALWACSESVPYPYPYQVYLDDKMAAYKDYRIG